MFERTLLTILVWGLILEILSLVHLSSTPGRFEFAYTFFLFVITSVALIVIIGRLRASLRKASPSSGDQKALSEEET